MTGGATVGSGGMGISGGLTVTGGLTVATGSVYIVNPLTVASKSGITVEKVIVNTGGVQVLQSGIQIYAGGLNVISGGLRVQGGTITATVASNLAAVTASGLITAQSGLTVTAGGLSVTAGATQVQALTAAATMTASAGLTVTSGGLSVTAGATQVQALTAAGLITASAGIALGGTTLTSAVLSTSSNYGDPNYYLSTSDRRLKSGLAPITNAMATISQLKGVYFYWTEAAQRGRVAEAEAKSPSARGLRGSNAGSGFLESAPVFDDRRHVGFVAQDVQAALPEAVAAMHGDRYLGVDYGAIVPVLVDALKETDQKIDAGQASVAAELAALRSLVAELRAGVVRLQEENQGIRGELRELRRTRA